VWSSALGTLTPASPAYSPASPAYSPGPPAYSPASAHYSPASPHYSPAVSSLPASNAYSPASPHYSPAPTGTPGLQGAAYSPASPLYSPASPAYSPMASRRCSVLRHLLGCVPGGTLSCHLGCGCFNVRNPRTVLCMVMVMVDTWLFLIDMRKLFF